MGASLVVVGAPLGELEPGAGDRREVGWDEAGRLQRARRWDLTSAGVASDAEPLGLPAAELRYQYDGGDQRTLKTAVDAAGSERHTVYVLGSLELRRAEYVSGDYAIGTYTVVPYLFAHGVRLARLAWEDSDVPSIPTLSNPRLHVFFELGDHLGSSSTVLDKDTSELVEKSTYLPYGGAESDYRPGRWKGFREDHRFTGKEGDEEVGLTYFGFRYLSTQLGRWMGADPKPLHGGGADLNLYAYVVGRLMSGTDPAGLSIRVDDSDVPFSPTGQRPKASKPLGGWADGVVDGLAETVLGQVGPILKFVGGDPKGAALSFGCQTPLFMGVCYAVGLYQHATGTKEAIKDIQAASASVDPTKKYEAAKKATESGAGLVFDLAILGVAAKTSMAPYQGPGPGKANIGTDALVELEAGGSDTALPKPETPPLPAPVKAKPEVASASPKTEFAYINPENSANGILASLHDGVLTTMIEDPSSIPNRIAGPELFAKAIEHFGKDVKAVRGYWVYGDNLAAFNKLTANGAISAEAAASMTFTGKMAAKYGFKSAEIVKLEGTPGNYTKVEVIFR